VGYLKGEKGQPNKRSEGGRTNACEKERRALLSSLRKRKGKKGTVPWKNTS